MFSDIAPADVLLLVGIFGNITDTDVERVISSVPTICNQGATVIWVGGCGCGVFTMCLRPDGDDIQPIVGPLSDTNRVSEATGTRGREQEHVSSHGPWRCRS